MTSRERHETELVAHDGHRRWKVTVQRQRYDRDVKSHVPCAPAVHIYPPDDRYYAIEFTSRARLQGFLQQLNRVADEVWPT